MKAQLFGKHTDPSSRGMSTIEILIAFSVLVISLSAVIMVVFSNQSVAIDTQTNIEAIAKAEANLEATRALSQTDFDSVGATGPIPDDIYQKSITVTDIDVTTKLVTSIVTWLASGGRTLSVSIPTVFTDHTQSCSQSLSGDWTAPQIYGYVDFASPTGATSVDVKKDKAYVTSDPSSAGTDDFYAVDVSDPKQGKGTLPILGHFSTSYGLTDIHVTGNYAYVTADSAAFQLLVIDISDPAALATSKIVAKKDMTAAGDTAIGNTLFYANKRLYVGLTKSSGPEFHIFDVSTPTNPVELGSGYEVNAAVNKIVVKNNIAYLTTASSNEILALNVTDPTSLTPAGAYSSITLTGQSLALNPAGTSLYFGRIGGTGNPKLLAFDASNLSTPVWTMDMVKQSGIYTMVLRGNLLFMTTADPSDGLQIWNVTSASSSVPPVRFDTSPLNIQQGATAGTDCFGNLLYVAQRSNRALQIVGPFVPSTYSLGNGGPVSVMAGSSISNTIDATLVAGAAQTVSFSAAGLPSGATATFAPSSCTVTCSTNLTISTLLTTPTGTYTITVTGSGGQITTFNLTVTAPSFDYSMGITPASLTVTRAGAAKTSTLTATLSSGTSQPVTFTNSALPSGVTIAYSASTCNPTCSTTLTVTAAGGAAVGTTPITITGAAPTHTTTLTITVQAPAFSYSLPTGLGDLTLIRGGAAVVQSVTVSMAAGAVPQAVTLTPTNPAPGEVTITPSSASCTPSATAPYTCSIDFSYQAAALATKKINNNQIVNGTPGAIQSNKYKVIVQ